ncbi:MAG TPA: LamG-like jellyroll fold domain-containing protein [Planctomycetota bacterium]|jgi:PKD repeat protein
MRILQRFRKFRCLVLALVIIGAIATPVLGIGVIIATLGGGCVSFNGTDTNVQVDNVAGLSGNAPSHTVEAWVYSVTPADNRSWVLTLGQMPTAARGGLHWLHNSAGSLTVGVSFGGAGSTIDVALDSSTWTHIAVTFDSATGLMTLYKNGASAGSVTLTTANRFLLADEGTGNIQLNLGKMQDIDGTGIGHYLSGNLDDVRVWNHARSAGEIARDYHAQLLGSEAGLVCYYRCEEADGAAQIADSSGHGNNGIVSGVSQFYVSDPAATERVYATSGTDRAITLAYHSLSANPVVTTITALPASGTLYQYNNGARGAAIALNDTVTDASNRVIYAAPAAAGERTFEYTCTVDASSKAATVKIEVQDQQQTITFAQPPDIAMPGNSITLSATASSGLPVNFSVVSGPATVAGSVLTSTGTGTLVVQADQPGDVNRLPAVPVQRTLHVLGSVQPFVYAGPDHKNDYLGDWQDYPPLRPLAVDAAGNVYMTGSAQSQHADTYNTLNKDIVTAKFDKDGNQLWSQTYDGAGHNDDGGYSIAVDGAGNVYVAGYARDAANNENMAMLKYDSSGNPSATWADSGAGQGVRFFLGSGAGAEANTLALAANGDLIVCGFSTDANNAITTLRYDSAGNLSATWPDLGDGVNGQGVRKYQSGTSQESKPYNIALDSMGNVYVCGYSRENHGYGANGDALVIQYQPNGTQGWAMTYDNPIGHSYDYFCDVQTDSHGNCVVSGYSTISGPSVGYLTAKYDGDGHLLWMNQFSGTNGRDCEAYSVAVGPDDSVYSFGYIDYDGNVDHYGLVKYSPDGVQQWVAVELARQAPSGPSRYYNDGQVVKVGKDGNIYVTGILWDGVQHDYLTIEYAPDGTKLWEHVYNGAAANSWDEAYALIVADDGTVYVGGSSQRDAAEGYDMVVVKISQVQQTIDFAAIADRVYTNSPLGLTATSSTGLPVTFSVVSGPATLNGNVLNITGPGSITVRATQAGEGVYMAAFADRTFVAKDTQTIAFNALSDKLTTDAPFALSATASSGLAVSFSIVSGPATLDGSTLTLTGAGKVTVRASQAGNATYVAAPLLDRSFNVYGPPEISSAATANPNPANVGESVQFSCSASDVLTLTYAWTFGDGTTATGSAASHAFSPSGTYAVQLTITNSAGASVTQSLSLQVNPAGAAEPAKTDSDGDGFGDQLEAAMGTDPMSAASTPFEGAAATSEQPIADVKLSIKLNFAKPGNDAIGVSGTMIVPETAMLSGAFDIVVGGVAAKFTLQNGAAKTATGAVKLSAKGKGFHSAKFSAKLSKGKFVDLLKDQGLVDANKSNAPVKILVSVLFNGTLYQADVSQTYSAKAKKSGATKDVK